MQVNGMEHPIIVVGAGPVGFFTAALLVDAGYPVMMLEKKGGLAMDMRASTFHPATLDLLAPLGLAEPLIECGSITQAWQYMIHETKNHAVFDLESIRGWTDHPFRLQCEQFNFTVLALERLEKSPLFEIRFNHQVTAVEDSGDEVRVRVHSPRGPQELTTSWLIAADGENSTVRQEMNLAFEGSDFPKSSITVVLDHPFQDEIPGLLGINFVWTDNDYYSLIQVRDLWRFTYSPDPAHTAAEALSEEVVQAHIQDAFPSERPYLLVLRNYHKLQQRCLDSFRKGRVLFAGDSAHLNSPSGGMGMNSGMHDAHCLVEHLLPVLEGAAPAGLDRYSRRRRTIALEEVQRLSARNHLWHREADRETRNLIWRELQTIVSDEEKSREFLLESSMIRSRQREFEIE
jgi:3-(3-hydroxy-phenyl)propionate hydroxylase